MKLANRSTALTLALALVATALVGGAAVAADETLADSTFNVNNDTQSVYAELEATDNFTDDGAPQNVSTNVTFYGVTNDSISEQVDTRSVEVAANDTLLEEYETNTSNYEQYRVVVEGNSTYVDAEVGTIAKAAGGSGGLASLASSVPGGLETLGGGAVALLAVVVVVFRVAMG